MLKLIFVQLFVCINKIKHLSLCLISKNVIEISFVNSLFCCNLFNILRINEVRYFQEPKNCLKM